jgi:hypothetical protein
MSGQGGPPADLDVGGRALVYLNAGGQSAGLTTKEGTHA